MQQQLKSSEILLRNAGGKLGQEIMLFARRDPHTSLKLQAIQKAEIEFFCHPLYSQDLAPSNHLVFGLLKKCFRGGGFLKDSIG